MTKPFLIVTLLLLLGGAAYGHNGTIRGGVFSKADHAPLAGATVVLTSQDKGTTTDVFGVFSFSNLAEGRYSLQVSYMGFKTVTQVVEVKSTETSLVTSYLERGEFSLSEVNVTAGQETPLNTISSIDINLRPTQNSQDVLRIVPGLFIAQHAGGGKAEQIFLRGFDIDHGTDISLSVDGMPVNMVSHAHGQGYSDLHFIIPETIEQVDFGKGPYEARQGNFATAGYADFSTRSRLSRSSLKLEAGRFDTYRAVGLFNLLGEGAQQKQQNAYLATEYMFTNGYFESPQNFNRINLFGRYNGLLDGNKVLSVSMASFGSKWDASGQIPERAIADGTISRFGAIDDTEGGSTSRQSLNISLMTVLPNNAVLDNQVYIIHYDFELYSNFTFFLHDSVNGDQIRQKEQRSIIGYKGAYSREGTLFNLPLKSVAGLGLRYDRVQDSELSRTLGRKITLSEVQKGDIDEVNASAYISETLELSPAWTVNAALRFDQFLFDYVSRLPADSVFNRQVASQNRFSPKLNLFYTYSPTLRLYASAGMGFHSNDTRVSVLADKNRILPAAYGADLGFIFKPLPSLVLHTALWALDLEEEFVYVGDEGIVEPSGKTRRYGVDVTARWQLSPYLFADGDLSVTRPRAREAAEGSDYIPLAPMVTSAGGLTFRNKTGLNASARYRYLKSRPANEDYSLTAEGYLLLNAVASYTLKNLELKLTAENLLNNDWKEAQFETESRLRNETEPVSEIHFTPGTPFFIKAGITYSF
ncbi:TonB-dependent receptor [Pontibacter sp. BT731]|uniref:TonB-dependent receptor n=1 Tax=Pontibacter coccineus TaxID=3063328 RepID=UPI0026E25D3A|nr:TonB-dependent receptor [Pontibacter sp. BT731]MDO6388707.1 TonB-dependent receptor [Pontibacter sp. BT731]